MTPEDKAKAGFVGIKKRSRVRELSASRAGKLPKLPEKLKPEIDAARERNKARPAQPGVRVYQTDDSWFLDSPHRDLEAWEVQICDTFGTRSQAVMWTFLDQITRLCQHRWKANGDSGKHVPDEMELNFILALLHSERPETPLQAALLVQMVANHLTQTRLQERTLGDSSWVDPLKASLSAKLANAFSNQTDAYLKLRGRIPEQKITVSYERHSHMHYHQHKHLHTGEGGGEFSGQAFGPNPIDSSVGKTGGPLQIEGRAHERSPALLGEDPAGVVVPIAGHAREGALPDTRRSQGQRRAKG